MITIFFQLTEHIPRELRIVLIADGDIVFLLYGFADSVSHYAAEHEEQYHYKDESHYHLGIYQLFQFLLKEIKEFHYPSPPRFSAL